MNYTLHQLNVFLKIYEKKSITKAAEELHLTQPAVSIQLKRLQEQFEIPLTEVIGRQLYITDFGNRVAEVCKSILRESEMLSSTINEYKGLLTGSIKFSIVSTGKYVMPYFLEGFMAKYPNVGITMDVSNKQAVVESLVKNDTDFALVSVLPDLILLNTIELMENKLYLAGSKKYQKEKITKNNLSNYTLIYREKGSATRNAMERYLERQVVTPSKKMTLVSNEAVKQAVKAGLGLSIMPLIGLKNELANKEIVLFDMPHLPVITNWNLVYNKGKQLTPAAKAFVDYLEEHKDKIVKEQFN